MVISLTINSTTVEINTGGIVRIETAKRQLYASKGPADVTPQPGEWVREGFGWHIISSPRG